MDLRRISERLRVIADPLALLQALLAGSPVAYHVIGADGISVVSNRAFVDLVGFEPQAGHDAFADARLTRLGVVEAARRALAGEVVELPATWVDPRDGRRRALEVTVFPLHGCDRAIGHVAVCARDATAELELRGASEALRRSEEELAATIESIGDAVIATDTNGEIVRMNGLAEHLTGWTLMDARGRHVAEVFRLAEPEEEGGAVDRATRKHEAVGFGRLSVLVARDGARTPISGTGAPIRDADGGLRGTVLVFRDVGEERRAEELRARSAELELQNRRMAEANRLKSEFLASMSHELRTPLNAILGFADLLAARRVDPASAQHDEFVRAIVDSGRHLLQLINDVLDLAKVEAGKLEFRPRPVALGSLVVEVVTILRAQADARAIAVAVDVDPSIGEVVIDPQRLKQVLYNYLSNALKFSAEGGAVDVRVRADGADAFRLEVEDRGPGIAPADLGRLFLEFQQLDTGVGRRHTGTGLGLALTRRLVEAQGGSVGVQSVPGRGSTFHAVLPRQARGGEVRISRRTLAPRMGAPTILVVESEPHDQAVLVSTLAEAGFAVDLVDNGADAVARCRERAFDAITLDFLLPDLSGLDLLGAIRTSERNRDVPVVAVTAAATTGAVPGDIDDVLAKPIDREELVAALRRATRRR